MDDAKFSDAADLTRGGQETPLTINELNDINSSYADEIAPSVDQQTHVLNWGDSTLPAAVQLTGGNRKIPTENTEMNSSCGMQQAQDTPHAPVPDELLVRHDGFVDTNKCAVDNDNSLTDVVFPVISSVDYTTIA